MKYIFIYLSLVFITNCLAEESISFLENKASSGDVDAQVELAMIYEEGLKVPKDDGKAFEWWSKAAEKNVDIAQYTVGLMYDQGRGIPQNKHMALEWYYKAAAQGLDLAQCQLGDIYKQGISVPQDDAKAFKWYQKAARQGNFIAQISLGEMYEHGDGVTKNLSKAKELYDKAAKQNPDLFSFLKTTRVHNRKLNNSTPQNFTQEISNETKQIITEAKNGDAKAQFKLGSMYEFGKGVPKDHSTAIEWYSKAAAQGHALAEAIVNSYKSEKKNNDENRFGNNGSDFTDW